MTYLLLSILASTVIFIVFNLFKKFNVHTLQAIVINYVVAGICGLIASGKEIDVPAITAAAWFPGAVGLGLLFIVIFNLMAITTQRSGLAVVSVATKMSVVIPVLFGILYYSESAGTLKIVGILLAVVAVYLASVKPENDLSVEPKNLLFPILVFLGSGVIDTSLKYLEGTYVASNEIPLFSASIFASAFIFGMFIILFLAIRRKLKFQAKNLLAGIGLGIPNYFSIYFLVQALRESGLDSSSLFTVNNVGIVLVATLVGIVAFRERLSVTNWVGLGLAILGIVLISLSI
ncbi:MAG: DMT family transporter [Leeuwenhoekiella sp.]